MYHYGTMPSQDSNPPPVNRKSDALPIAPSSHRT